MPRILMAISRFLFVEGFLLFSDETVLSLLDVRIFIKGTPAVRRFRGLTLSQAKKETCLARRYGRKERTRSEEEQFLLYFERYIWPSYEQHNGAHVTSMLVHLI